MARTCIISFRSLDRTPVRTMSYEFEDVAAEVDDVDIAAPTKSAATDIGYRAISKYLGRSRRATGLDLRFGAPPMAEEYELLFTILGFPREVAVMHSLPHWRQRTHRAVCVLRELWVAELGLRKGMIAHLNQFDHVFVEYAHTVAPLQAMLDVPVSFMAPSVDTVLFSPLPWQPDRSIYVTNIGRRNEDLHHRLQAETAGRGLFYNYTAVAPIEAWNAPDHRALLAEMLMRSRYSIVTRAKFDAPELLGQEEAGFRYFEGAAAGAVLVGQQVHNDQMPGLFDWPDAVIEVPDDQVVETLRALDEQPERVQAIRRASVAASLRRHDCAHRWQQVLDAAGLAALPRMRARLDRLDALAVQAETLRPG